MTKIWDGGKVFSAASEVAAISSADLYSRGSDEKSSVFCVGVGFCSGFELGAWCRVGFEEDEESCEGVAIREVS